MRIERRRRIEVDRSAPPPRASHTAMARGGRLAGAARLVAAALAGALPLLVAPVAAEETPASTSEALARRLAASIRFETVSPEDPSRFRGEPFEALAAWLRSQYPRTHAALALERINRHTLLYTWRGRDARLAPALFLSHTDVVPVEPAAAEQWTHPPYAGVIADGYVWGRGAIDDKLGVLLWLEAVEALLAEGVTPRRTIHLAFGHDEEISGLEGARVVAERLRARGERLAFLFDEGGMILDAHPLLPDRTAALIVTAEKAYYTVELVARGVSGHSSAPPPSTAIGRLARAIHRIESHPMPARLTLPLRQMLAAARPHLPFGQRLALSNLWLTAGLVKRRFLEDDLEAALVRTTFAATMIEGGVKENVIPERARAIVNVRILPGDMPEDVLAHLEAVIDDPEIEIRGRAWGEAAPAASADGPAFALAAAAVTEVLPEAVILPGLVPGATDSRHFAGVADEILRFVPMRLGMEQVGGAHGRDERIAVETLADSRAIAIGMLRRAAAGVDVVGRAGPGLDR